MEDKKRKKDEKRKREAPQKVTEQKNKVLDITKSAAAQPPSVQSSSASPSPGPTPSPSPSPAPTGPGSAATQLQGGNNAKRLAVANGQPTPTTSSSSIAGNSSANGSAGSGGGAQAPQQQPRYMPREVPPRFRCQQDHKVLLKRGQPPLSSMLLGGGGGGEGPNANLVVVSDCGSAASSLAPTSSVAASTTTSNYANSMWGASSGSQASSQGREKVIVDGNDLEEWPSIAGNDSVGAPFTMAGGGSSNNGMPVNSVSASGNQSSPTSLFSSPNECIQSSNSVAWGTTASQGHLGGGNAVAVAGSLLQQSSSLSKASAVPGSHDASGPAVSSSGIPGANFHPNANPSAWPALVQQNGPPAAGEGQSSFKQPGTAGPANNSASLRLGAGAGGVPGGHPPLSVNQSSTHQHQLHQIQSRERGVEVGKWDSESAGPKIAGGGAVESGMDCAGPEGRENVSDHSHASSWRNQTSYPAASSKAGASRTDGWESGECGFGAAEEDNGTSAWGYPPSTTGVNSWSSAGTGGNSSQTSRESQGPWGSSGVVGERVVPSGDWGGGCSTSRSTPGGEEIEGICSSNSSSCGDSASGIPPVTSTSASSSMTRAWDNQKGEAEMGEWGVATGAQGTRANSSSSGGNSKSGSSGGQSRPRRQASNTEAALQNLLSRPDLDPRVLSNTGWGQTQIRQNTSWDMEEQGKNKNAPQSATSKQPQSISGYSQYSGGSRNPVCDSIGGGLIPSTVPSVVSSGEGWESSSNSSSSGASTSGRAPPSSVSSMRNIGISQPGTSCAIPGHVQQGRSMGWGGAGSRDSQEAKSWANEEWRNARGGNGWGDLGQQGEPTSGGWAGSKEDKGTGAWKDLGGDGGRGWGSGQNVGGGRDWREEESKSTSSVAGWEEDRKNSGGNSGGDSAVGDWGSWDQGASRRTMGTGEASGGGAVGAGGGMGGHSNWSGGNKNNQMPNSQSGSVTGLQAQLQQQQSQSCNHPPQQALDQENMQVGVGRKPISQAQNQSSGWTSGPIPGCPPGGLSGSEASGWEEPSPQSISRKNEIDDGTSAWGDPTNYNYRPVNLWDKNSAHAGQQPQPQSQAQQSGPAIRQQPNRQVATNRDLNAGHGPGTTASMGTTGWGATSSVSPNLDNGTAAWGKPTDAPSGWGDPDEATGKSTGWGNPPPNPIKSGSKSMQDGWGDKEGSVAASRHSSWEEDDDGGGMWNSTGSQGSGSSWGQGSNGGWGQSHTSKKPINKGPLKTGGGDSWMSPINRQFSNMGLMNDDSPSQNMDLTPGALQDKRLDMDKRGLVMMDYNGDIRKAARGGGGMSYRSPVPREATPMDAGSYYDKTLTLNNQDGCSGEEGLCSLYSPPTAHKTSSLFNHSIPFRQGGHSIFSSSGGVAQSRHQPNVAPINQSPGIRAQLPHQFLSPQVPGSMLKQMPPPTGTVGGVSGVAGVGAGVFPPQLSPQHIAMLSSIYPPHIQFQLACQLILQQQQQPPQQQQQQHLLQNQRKFTPNVRPQADPQQLARIMAVLQQQRQQQQVGGLGSSNTKLSPSHHGGIGAKLPGADPLPNQGMSASIADLHQKHPGPYSGFNSGMNLSGLDLGSSAVGGPGGMKDFGGQQSRFKWMMEGQSSPDPVSSDSTFHKNGPITPMKIPGGSAYSQYDMMPGDGLNNNWHRTPGNKLGSKPAATPSWPPEFQPGVPWKGIDRVDPESDPYMTPGSMMGNAVSPSLNDNEHQLLQDNSDSTPPLNTLLPSPGAWPYSASDSPLNNAHNSAKYTEYKTSWPPEPIGHKWKANRSSNQSQLSRPPPGLASQKQPSPSPWSGSAPRMPSRGWTSGSNTTGSAWSDGSALESCWLVLSNLTPQIDGSTLRTICMQHGPLLTFHLGLTQGTALIRYNSKQEAAKAQSALHMCVLGNTTILAEFVSEEDVARYIAHSQAGGGGSGGATATSPGSAPAASTAVGTNGNGGNCDRGGSGAVEGSVAAVAVGGTGPSSSGWQTLDSTGSSVDQSAPSGPGLGIFAQWSSNASGVGGPAGSEAGRQGLWGGMSGAGYPSSSLWGSPALEDRHQMGSPASLLPGDLLGGGADSI
ncbi:trinucleotide repeat-containing gene 6B protein isoform 1-T1 [Synchiropus picturatus]